MSNSENRFPEQRWLEDFTLGQKFNYGQWLMKRSEMLDFANLYDPEPFHTDEAAAKQLGWKDIIASGPQISALWRRMSKDAFPNAEVVISPGWDHIRWYMPVYAGDMLSVETEIVEARTLSSRPSEGVIKLQNRILRNDDLVSELSSTWFVRRKP